MISFRSNKRLRLKRAVVMILLIAVIASTFMVFVDLRLRELVKAFAKSEIKTALINAANRSCERILSDNAVSYDDLAVISRDESGLATSVEIDTVSANLLKATLTNEIAKELALISTRTISVPLCAAFGIYYTSFKTPTISYTVHITTTVTSDFKSNFYSAGINQVLHQIVLNVGLESDIAMLSEKTENSFSTNFLIAQTVIVGAVPEAFTEVKNATDEVMEDIFDFGAENVP